GVRVHDDRTGARVHRRWRTQTYGTAADRCGRTLRLLSGGPGRGIASGLPDLGMWEGGMSHHHAPSGRGKYPKSQENVSWLVPGTNCWNTCESTVSTDCVFPRTAAAWSHPSVACPPTENRSAALCGRSTPSRSPRADGPPAA